MAYIETATNPLTGQPYGQGWWHNLTFQGSLMDSPAESYAKQVAGLGVFNQNTNGRRSFLADWVSGDAPVNASAHMLALMDIDRRNDPANNLAKPYEFTTWVGNEADAVHGNALTSTFYPQLAAAFEDALSVAQRQAAFDAGRTGLDRGDLYRLAQRDVIRERNQIQAPELDKSYLDFWQSQLPAVSQSGTSNPIGTTPNLVTNLDTANADNLQNGWWLNLNSWLNQVGQGSELGGLGDEMAAVAAQGLQQRKSAGQIRREFAKAYNSVPLSALEGDEFSTFTTPAAGQGDTYKGRIV